MTSVRIGVRFSDQEEKLKLPQSPEPPTVRSAAKSEAHLQQCQATGRWIKQTLDDFCVSYYTHPPWCKILLRADPFSIYTFTFSLSSRSRNLKYIRVQPVIRGRLLAAHQGGRWKTDRGGFSPQRDTNIIRAERERLESHFHSTPTQMVLKHVSPPLSVL